MKFQLDLTGTAPLLMHNIRLANPIDPFTRRLAELTGKRGKTYEDHESIADREWEGGLYYDPEVGVYLPGASIHASLVEGAKVHKNGKSVKEAVLILTDQNPLQYNGPRDIAKLRDDHNFRQMNSVKVGMARTMRCRPFFRNWSTSCIGWLDTDILNWDDFLQACRIAGQRKGIGDWRPMYGRFDVMSTQLGTEL